jgi:hypothetical protein
MLNGDEPTTRPTMFDPDILSTFVKNHLLFSAVADAVRSTAFLPAVGHMIEEYGPLRWSKESGIDDIAPGMALVPTEAGVAW